MQLLDSILIHGIVFAIILTFYLLVVMRGLSPRIWAFSDYPKSITSSVPPQADRERRIAAYTAVPYFILGMMLENLYGGSMPLLDAFLNFFGIVMFGNLADFLILDWLIVGTITPEWVIIPGTEHMRDKEYKEFRGYHARGHVRALPMLAILSLILAAAVVFI